MGFRRWRGPAKASAPIIHVDGVIWLPPRGARAGEGGVAKRVPILCREGMAKASQQTVDHGNDRVAARDRQFAARPESGCTSINPRTSFA